MSGLSRWCNIVNYTMCQHCLYLYESRSCSPLKLLMHIHGDLGSTCARREDRPQWAAVSLSCSLKQPLSVTSPYNQRLTAAFLSVQSLKGHDILFNMWLAGSLSDGFAFQHVYVSGNKNNQKTDEICWLCYFCICIDGNVCARAPEPLRVNMSVHKCSPAAACLF